MPEKQRQRDEMAVSANRMESEGESMGNLGLLYVGKVSDLVDLYEATQFAAEQIAIHAARYGLQTV
ncbi:MAG: hypothetical protein F4W95_00270 [Chloroflexi bacterium]|nr:hypothetical protein [Chloroflexota bacterium]MYD46902.1 hypothetical protein [Chloroflexota bacterium]